MPNPPPVRRPNAATRGGREHLTEDEVERIIRAAGGGRHAHRDRAMILIAYTHALRAKEVTGLRWDKLDRKDKTIYIDRVKGSVSGVHTLRDREIKALSKLGWKRSGPVFPSQQGGAMTTNNFHQIVAGAGRTAGIGIPVHPHMLRHGTGYRLVNMGVDLRVIQDWMGHANVQNTVGYTRLAAGRFAAAKLWED